MFAKSLIILVGGLALASGAHRCATAAPGDPRLQISGPEEIIFDDRTSNCTSRQFPDSPARAVRQANGEIVLFATFETNWFFAGPDWNALKPQCKSAGQAAENPDPRALDDKYWIQALYSQNGRSFIALGSHEYLGARHPGMCNHTTTGTMAPPCWFSSITQYFSQGDAKTFLPAKVGHVVATPQMPFDANALKRVGYFTTSNIVADGRYRYVLVFASDSPIQKSGNCLFRSEIVDGPSEWRAWNGTEFSVDLSHLPQSEPKQPATCKPVNGLGHEARGLVKDVRTGLWIVTYTGRIRDKTGIVYSVSRDLFNWTSEAMLLEAPLTRRDPDCAPVYRYPSLIDHEAPRFSFDTIENLPYLYSTKILLDGCRQSARQVVRMPLKMDVSH